LARSARNHSRQKRSAPNADKQSIEHRQGLRARRRAPYQTRALATGI